MLLFKIQSFISGLIGAQTIDPTVKIPTWIIGNLGDYLGDKFYALFNWFCRGIYFLCKWLMAFTDFLQYFIQKLIGLDYWLNNTTYTLEGIVESDIIFSFLYNDTVQRTFKAMIGVFIILLIIFTIYAIIKSEWTYITGDQFGSGSNSKGKIIRESLKAIAIVLMFPVLLIVGIISSNAILASLVKALQIDTGSTFGQQIFSVSTQNANRYRNYAKADARQAVSDQVSFYIDSTSGKLISLSNYSDYQSYLAAISSATKYTVNSIFDVIDPNDYDSSNFYGYAIMISTSELGNIYYFVACSSSEKDAYYYYLKNVLEVTILTRSYSSEEIVKQVRSKMDSTGFISGLDLSDAADSSKAVRNACYNTLGYYSVYTQTFSFAETVSSLTVNISNTFKDTSGSLSSSSSSSSSIWGYSSARLLYNSSLISSYFDGGETGIVQLQNEYYVMSDVVDFMADNDVTIYFLNVNSNLIDWSYTNYHVDSKYASISSSGSLNWFNLVTDSSTNTGYYNYTNNADASSITPFIVEYSDKANDQEAGRILYTSTYGATSELDGALFICCYMVSDGSGSTKYVPLVNGLSFTDPVTGSSYTFRSDYYASNYRGIVIAKGIFDTSHTDSGNGLPTYISATSTVTSDSGTTISTTSPYYYEMVQSGTITQSAVVKDEDKTISANYTDIPFSIDSDTNQNASDYEFTQSDGGFTLSRNGETVTNLSSVMSSVIFSVNSYGELRWTGYSKTSGTYTYYLFTTDYDDIGYEGKYVVITVDSSDGKITFDGSTTTKTVTLSYQTYTLQYTYKATDATSDETPVDSETVTAGAFRNVSGSQYSTRYKYESYNDSYEYYTINFSDDGNGNLVWIDNEGNIEFAGVSSGSGTSSDVSRGYYTFYLYNYYTAAIDGNHTDSSISKTDFDSDSYYLVTFENDQNGEVVVSRPTDETMCFTILINEFSGWSDSSSSLALYNGDNYVAQIYKNSSDTTISSSSDLATNSVSILYNGETYYNIRSQNYYTDLSSAQTYYTSLSQSYITEFKLSCVENFGVYISLNFWFIGWRFAFMVSPYQVNHEYTLSTNFKISDGISFDYFFDDAISLQDFYYPARISYWIIFIACLLIIKVLMKAIWGVIKRFYEITLYYIAMPAVASYYPIDDKKFNSAILNPLITKVLSTYGVILGLNVFFILLTPVKEISEIFTEEDIATSGSYFLTHLPISADALNMYVYIMFMLVAFTMVDDLPGIVSEIVTGNKGGDIVASGEQAREKSKQQRKDVADTWSGKKIVDGADKLKKEVKDAIPGSSIVGAMMEHRRRKKEKQAEDGTPEQRGSSDAQNEINKQNSASGITTQSGDGSQQSSRSNEAETAEGASTELENSVQNDTGLDSSEVMMSGNQDEQDIVKASEITNGITEQKVAENAQSSFNKQQLGDLNEEDTAETVRSVAQSNVAGSKGEEMASKIAGKVVSNAGGENEQKSKIDSAINSLSSEAKIEAISSTLTGKDKEEFESSIKNASSSAERDQIIKQFTFSGSVDKNGALQMSVQKNAVIKDGSVVMSDAVALDSKANQNLIGEMFKSKDVFTNSEIVKATNETGNLDRIKTILSNNMALGGDKFNEQVVSKGKENDEIMAEATLKTLLESDDENAKQALFNKSSIINKILKQDGIEVDKDLLETDPAYRKNIAKIVYEQSKNDKQLNKFFSQNKNLNALQSNVLSTAKQFALQGKFSVNAWDLADEGTKDRAIQEEKAFVENVKNNSILKNASEEEKNNIISNTAKNLIFESGNQEIAKQTRDAIFENSITDEDLKNPASELVIKKLLGKENQDYETVIANLSKEEKRLLGFAKLHSGGNLDSINYRDESEITEIIGASQNIAEQDEIIKNMSSKDISSAIEQNGKMSSFIENYATINSAYSITNDQLVEQEAKFAQSEDAFADENNKNAVEKMFTDYQKANGVDDKNIKTLEEADSATVQEFLKSNKDAEKIIKDEMISADEFDFKSIANKSYSQQLVLTDSQRETENKMSREEIDKASKDDIIFNTFKNADVENKDEIINQMIIAHSGTENEEKRNEVLKTLKDSGLDISVMGEDNAILAYERAKILGKTKDKNGKDLTGNALSGTIVQMFNKMNNGSEEEIKKLNSETLEKLYESKKNRSADAQKALEVLTSDSSTYVSEYQREELIDIASKSGFNAIDDNDRQKVITKLKGQLGDIGDDKLEDIASSKSYYEISRMLSDETITTEKIQDEIKNRDVKEQFLDLYTKRSETLIDYDQILDHMSTSDSKTSKEARKNLVSRIFAGSNSYISDGETLNLGATSLNDYEQDQIGKREALDVFKNGQYKDIYKNTLNDVKDTDEFKDYIIEAKKEALIKFDEQGFNTVKENLQKKTTRRIITDADVVDYYEKNKIIKTNMLKDAEQNATDSYVLTEALKNDVALDDNLKQVQKEAILEEEQKRFVLGLTGENAISADIIRSDSSRFEKFKREYNKENSHTTEFNKLDKAEQDRILAEEFNKTSTKEEQHEVHRKYLEKLQSKSVGVIKQGVNIEEIINQAQSANLSIDTYLKNRITSDDVLTTSSKILKKTSGLSGVGTTELSGDELSKAVIETIKQNKTSTSIGDISKIYQSLELTDSTIANEKKQIAREHAESELDSDVYQNFVESKTKAGQIGNTRKQAKQRKEELGNQILVEALNAVGETGYTTEDIKNLDSSVKSKILGDKKSFADLNEQELYRATQYIKHINQGGLDVSEVDETTHSKELELMSQARANTIFSNLKGIEKQRERAIIYGLVGFRWGSDLEDQSAIVDQMVKAYSGNEIEETRKKNLENLTDAHVIGINSSENEKEEMLLAYEKAKILGLTKDEKGKELEGEELRVAVSDMHRKMADGSANEINQINNDIIHNLYRESETNEKAQSAIDVITSKSRTNASEKQREKAIINAFQTSQVKGKEEIVNQMVRAYSESDRATALKQLKNTSLVQEMGEEKALIAYEKAKILGLNKGKDGKELEGEELATAIKGISSGTDEEINNRNNQIIENLYNESKTNANARKSIEVLTSESNTNITETQKEEIGNQIMVEALNAVGETGYTTEDIKNLDSSVKSKILGNKKSYAELDEKELYIATQYIKNAKNGIVDASKIDEKEIELMSQVRANAFNNYSSTVVTDAQREEAIVNAFQNSQVKGKEEIVDQMVRAYSESDRATALKQLENTSLVKEMGEEKALIAYEKAKILGLNKGINGKELEGEELATAIKGISNGTDEEINDRNNKIIENLYNESKTNNANARKSIEVLTSKTSTVVTDTQREEAIVNAFQNSQVKGKEEIVDQMVRAYSESDNKEIREKNLEILKNAGLDTSKMGEEKALIAYEKAKILGKIKGDSELLALDDISAIMEISNGTDEEINTINNKILDNLYSESKTNANARKSIEVLTSRSSTEITETQKEEIGNQIMVEALNAVGETSYTTEDIKNLDSEVKTKILGNKKSYAELDEKELYIATQYIKNAKNGIVDESKIDEKEIELMSQIKAKALDNYSSTVVTDTQREEIIIEGFKNSKFKGKGEIVDQMVKEYNSNRDELVAISQLRTTNLVQEMGEEKALIAYEKARMLGLTKGKDGKDLRGDELANAIKGIRDGSKDDIIFDKLYSEFKSNNADANRAIGILTNKSSTKISDSKREELVINALKESSYYYDKKKTIDQVVKAYSGNEIEETRKTNLEILEKSGFEIDKMSEEEKDEILLDYEKTKILGLNKGKDGKELEGEELATAIKGISSGTDEEINDRNNQIIENLYNESKTNANARKSIEVLTNSSSAYSKERQREKAIINAFQNSQVKDKEEFIDEMLKVYSGNDNKRIRDFHLAILENAGIDTSKMGEEKALIAYERAKVLGLTKDEKGKELEGEALADAISKISSGSEEENNEIFEKLYKESKKYYGNVNAKRAIEVLTNKSSIESLEKQREELIINGLKNSDVEKQEEIINQMLIAHSGTEKEETRKTNLEKLEKAGVNINVMGEDNALLAYERAKILGLTKGKNGKELTGKTFADAINQMYDKIENGTDEEINTINNKILDNLYSESKTNANARKSIEVLTSRSSTEITETQKEEIGNQIMVEALNAVGETGYTTEDIKNLDSSVKSKILGNKKSYAELDEKELYRATQYIKNAKLGIIDASKIDKTIYNDELNLMFQARTKAVTNFTENNEDIKAMAEQRMLRDSGIPDESKMSETQKKAYQYNKSILTRMTAEKGNESLLNIFKNTNLVNDREILKNILGKEYKETDSVKDLKEKVDKDALKTYLDKNEKLKDTYISLGANNLYLTQSKESIKKRNLEAVENNNVLKETVARQALDNEMTRSEIKSEIEKMLKAQGKSEQEAETLAENNFNEYATQFAINRYFDKNGKTKSTEENAISQTIEQLSITNNSFEKNLYNEVTRKVDFSANATSQQWEQFLNNNIIQNGTQEITTLGKGLKKGFKNLGDQLNKFFEHPIDNTVGAAGRGISSGTERLVQSAIFKFSGRLPSNSNHYQYWNRSIQKQIESIKKGEGASKSLTKQERETRIKELEDKIIYVGNSRPADFKNMSQEEQRLFIEKQTKLKAEAFKNKDFSYVKDKNSGVKQTKQSITNRFATSFGKTLHLSGKLATEDLKNKHKDELSDINARISEYNSRKDSGNLDFSNWGSIEQLAGTFLTNEEANRFIKRYKDGYGKGEISDEEMQKRLEKLLGKKYKAASAKVAHDSGVSKKSFLTERAVGENVVRYRNGIKKFSAIESYIKTPNGKTVVGGSGNMHNSVSNLPKRHARRTNKKLATAQSRMSLYENQLRTFNEFCQNFKGTSQQFKDEVEKNFKEVANSVYNRKNPITRLDARTPIQIQKREIAKQLANSMHKEMKRVKFKSNMIPAGVDSIMFFNGKTMTNARSKTQVNIDKQIAEDISRTLNLVSTQKAYVDFNSVIRRIEPSLLSGFNLKKLSGLTNDQKFEQLEKFLNKKLEKANARVSNNQFFKDEKEKLKKLNGIYFNKKDVNFDKASQTMKNIVFQSDEMYKSIVKNYERDNSKYLAEREKNRILREQIDKLKAERQTAGIRNKIAEMDRAIKDSNVKLKVLNSAMERSLKRKIEYERRYAENRIKEAKRSVTREMFGSGRINVHDNYEFKLTDGSTVDPNSAVGKSVERISSNFVSAFKGALQRLENELRISNAKLSNEFNNKLRNLSNDFGDNLGGFRDSMKMLKNEVEALEGSTESSDIALKRLLEDNIDRLNNIDREMKSGFKNSNIDMRRTTKK